MSIKLKLLAIFGGFVVLMGLFVFTTIWMVRAQTSDGIIINVAGKQEVLTQIMTKDALALSLGIEAAREKLAVNSGLFDTNLNALIKGGQVSTSSEQQFELPPPRDEKILEQINKVKGLWDEFYKNVMVMLNKDSDLSAFAAAAKFIEERNMALLEEMRYATEMYTVAAGRKLHTLLITAIVFLLISIVIVVMGWVIIMRFIVNPINRVLEFAKSVAKGDLTVPLIKVKSMDEMGVLGEALNSMKENLNSIMSKMSAASARITSVAAELASSSGRISQGSETQSDQTVRIASAMEEMSASAIEIARSSHSAAESSKNANETAIKGGDVVSKGIEGIIAVSETIKVSAATVETLGKSSDEVGSIVAVINDIADQTNLLALNAAIEAARAGELGRGFAIVADEVRKLAEKTARATKEIAEKIKAIQKDTRGAIASIHEGTIQAEKGVKFAKDAKDALEQIVSSVEIVSNLVRQIATAAEQQSSTSEAISANIAEIAGVAKETAGGVKEISVAAEDLSKTAEELKGIIGTFVIEKG